ncbi:tRNA adenosine(34) deaminase TadA [Vagococcus intermedius]|uniref:tRNA-specific adenosine deaminase n=1 Tax=Vagococcus intermedius TaxID=2991418 RepID=A0AAF0I8U7_9ENTE|nr:tRNA adenosine(34) deaminase TadA [Vagococcus intermedius]WEG72872.1 tRNA adenosine(34) deaminase TadA [Vagococcus intermedius]WEG74959.1 tRNA adenosine(34) deaminase TadA [Vagococcus intermedius]
MGKNSSLTDEEKKFFMSEAISEAKLAEAKGEVPIGAIVVHRGKIIGRGHNIREISQNATTHAEMLAIQEACGKIENWRLAESQLFVTLEPCPMCSGAIILSRVDEVYYGAKDPKAGVAGSLMNLLEDVRFNHQCYVEFGILEKECGEILTSFFKKLRERNKERKKLKQLEQKNVNKD